MRKILLGLFICLNSFVLTAQESELTWYNNIDKAMEISKKENKPLMMFFTGSDWCGWCIRLQKEVFYKKEFVQWAKDNVVLVELDFPRNKQLDPKIKEQNSALQNAFQVQSYPTIWFVNSQTKEGKTNFTQLGRTGYVAGGPEAWISGANQILNNNKKG